MISEAAGGETRQALVVGVFCYVFWGLTPALFIVMGRAGASPWEIVAHRALWSAPWAGLLVLIAGQGAQVRAVFSSPRRLGLLALSAVDRFGFGAIALAAVGVALQAAALGHVPAISLFLATTFWLYGLIRKRIDVDAQTGLFVESLLMTGPGLVYVLWLHHAGGGVFARAPGATVLMMTAGPATVAPLALFAWTARRLTFAAFGFLQFISPTIGFLIGLAIGERLDPLGVASFAFIWSGCAVFVFGAWRASRQLGLAA